MDALSGISCCFDASKDIGETSVELVVCNCAVSRKCCTRWEQTTFVLALAFSMMDFVADLVGYLEFVKIVEDTSDIQPLINVWLAFLIISGIVMVSEILLPAYSLYSTCSCSKDLDPEEDGLEKLRRQTRYWNRANSLLVVLSEDGVIALARILIAFRSVEAIDDLQSVQGKTSAMMSFFITLLRHGMLVVQIVAKMGKNRLELWRCPWCPADSCAPSTKGLYAFQLTLLLFSCCALGTTAMSMAISMDAIAIHVDDAADFALNVLLLTLSIPGSFLVSLFVLLMSRW